MALSANSCGWTGAELLDSCMGRLKGLPCSEASLFGNEEGVEGAHYPGTNLDEWGLNSPGSLFKTFQYSSLWGSGSQDGGIMTCGWHVSLCFHGDWVGRVVVETVQALLRSKNQPFRNLVMSTPRCDQPRFLSCPFVSPSSKASGGICFLW